MVSIKHNRINMRVILFILVIFYPILLNATNLNVAIATKTMKNYELASQKAQFHLTIIDQFLRIEGGLGRWEERIIDYVLIRKGDKFYFESQEVHPIHDNPRLRTHEKGVYNNFTTKLFLPNTNQAVIKAGLFRYHLVPVERHLLLRRWGKPLSYWISNTANVISRTTDDSGQGIISINIPKEHGLHRRIELDPSKDYTVKKIVQTYEDGAIAMLLNVKNMKRDDNKGIWIPENVEFFWFDPHGKVLYQSEMQLQKALFNQEIDDSIFQLDIPSDAIITRW